MRTRLKHIKNLCIVFCLLWLFFHLSSTTHENFSRHFTSSSSTGRCLSFSSTFRFWTSRIGTLSVGICREFPWIHVILVSSFYPSEPTPSPSPGSSLPLDEENSFGELPVVIFDDRMNSIHSNLHKKSNETLKATKCAIDVKDFEIGKDAPTCPAKSEENRKLNPLSSFGKKLLMLPSVAFMHNPPIPYTPENFRDEKSMGLVPYKPTPPFLTSFLSSVKRNMPKCQTDAGQLSLTCEVLFSYEPLFGETRVSVTLYLEKEGGGAQQAAAAGSGNLQLRVQFGHLMDKKIKLMGVHQGYFPKLAKCVDLIELLDEGLLSIQACANFEKLFLDWKHMRFSVALSLKASLLRTHFNILSYSTRTAFGEFSPCVVHDHPSVCLKEHRDVCGWCSSVDLCLQATGPRHPSICEPCAWLLPGEPENFTTCLQKQIPRTFATASLPGYPCGWCSTSKKCRLGDEWGPFGLPECLGDWIFDESKTKNVAAVPQLAVGN